VIIQQHLFFYFQLAQTVVGCGGCENGRPISFDSATDKTDKTLNGMVYQPKRVEGTKHLSREKSWPAV
jgi:hypothetical protein